MDGIREMSKRISSHCSAVEHAARLLGSIRGVTLTAEEVEDGLIAILGLENPVHLLDRDWTADEIIQALGDFNFAALKPEVLAIVVLDASVIPRGVRRRLDEVKIKTRGEVWHIHKNDADPFPSTRHAHNYDSGYTMHLGTGDLYLDRKVVGRISRRNLIDFRQRPEIRNLRLPTLVA